ncbi:hypothetical protein OC834_006482 [Tilletia horrida]|nr:hypothetical protein OC834_006482 [Tilletia horrida]
MLPRVLMPIQFGSQNVQLYTYIAGLNPDCIAFGTYDPSKSTSAIRYPDIFVNEFGVGPRKGHIYSETAYVAGVPVMNVTLGYVPASSSDPSMCGIAWPHPGASFIGDAYDPWLETAMDYGAMYPSWFSIQYRLGGVSTMSFGASIPEVPSPASWVTSDPDAPGFWSLPGSIGGISSYLIVDPSASTIFGSTKDITAIIKSLGLEHSAFRDEDNLIIGTAKVPISKEVMTFGKDAKGNCILPMRGSDDEKYPPSLGSPFLASLKSIVFDYEARAVSVIPL